MGGIWYLCINTLSTCTVCLNAFYRVSTETVETCVHCLWGYYILHGGYLLFYSWVSSPVCLLPSPGFL